MESEIKLSQPKKKAKMKIPECFGHPDSVDLSCESCPVEDECDEKFFEEVRFQESLGVSQFENFLKKEHGV